MGEVRWENLRPAENHGFHAGVTRVRKRVSPRVTSASRQSGGECSSRRLRASNLDKERVRRALNVRARRGQVPRSASSITVEVEYSFHGPSWG